MLVIGEAVVHGEGEGSSLRLDGAGEAGGSPEGLVKDEDDLAAVTEFVFSCEKPFVLGEGWVKCNLLVEGSCNGQDNLLRVEGCVVCCVDRAGSCGRVLFYFGYRT